MSLRARLGLLLRTTLHRELSRLGQDTILLVVVVADDVDLETGSILLACVHTSTDICTEYTCCIQG